MNVFAKKIKMVVFVVLVFLLTCPWFVFATTYKQFEEIPGQERTDDFVVYLENLYKFGIAISALLAIFMIAIGAFIYVATSAGNASKMADAKDMIYNAIYGLVIALIAFLIFFVINPDLVRNTFDDVPGIEELRWHRTDGLH